MTNQWLEDRHLLHAVRHSDQHVDPENPKHAHCEMTAECVEHVRWDVFSLRNCVQTLAIWGHAFSCCNLR